jgi:hypothetical protein
MPNINTILKKCTDILNAHVDRTNSIEISKTTMKYISYGVFPSTIQLTIFPFLLTTYFGRTRPSSCVYYNMSLKLLRYMVFPSFNITYECDTL